MGDKIVYSTESGDLRQPEDSKQRKKGPGPLSSGIKNDGIVRVQKENKGRGGKTVTVVYGLNLPPAELASFASKLKQKCGTGGTVKDGVVLIQGDKADMLVAHLLNEGFTVKRAGA
jgi:translation initiation factor 1